MEEKKMKKSTRIKNQVKHDLAVFKNTRALCFAASLAAMSLILGKFLQIPNPFQEIIRISFENLPLLLSGIVMGPAVGLLTGAVADLLGCALYGYAVNPIITLGAASVGFIAGIIARYVVRSGVVLRVILSGTLAHLVGSVLIKTLGLAAWYLSAYNMGLWQLMLWRLLTYTLIAVLECTILCWLMKHKTFANVFERMGK